MFLSNYSQSDSESEPNKTLASQIRHGSAHVCQSLLQLRSGLFSSRHNCRLHLLQNQSVQCLPHTCSPYFDLFMSHSLHLVCTRFCLELGFGLAQHGKWLPTSRRQVSVRQVTLRLGLVTEELLHCCFTSLSLKERYLSFVFLIL